MRVRVLTATVLLLALLLGARKTAHGESNRLPSHDVKYVEVDGIKWGFENTGGPTTCWIWPETLKNPKTGEFKRTQKMPAKLTLPSEIETEIEGQGKVKLTVIAVYWSAFEDCKELEEVTIPKTFVQITSRSFRNCSNLKKVNIPKGLSRFEIANEAFFLCTKLKEIDIPIGANFIGERTFGNSGIEKITIPGTVTLIKELAFQDCNSLKIVDMMPGKGITIERGAFQGCKNIDAVTIPHGVTRMGSEDFTKLTGLSGSIFGDEGKTPSKIFFLADADALTSSDDAFGHGLNDATLYIRKDNKAKLEAKEWNWVKELKKNNKIVECPVVTFMDGGKIFTEQLVPVNGKATMPGVKPWREGANFAKWITEDGQEYDFDAEVTTDIALLASFDKCGVSFDPNGGTYAGKKELTVDAGSSVNEPTEKPTFEGRTFVGWYSKGLNTPYNFSNKVLSFVEVFAMWDKYVVTLDLNGGKLKADEKSTAEATYLQPLDKSKLPTPTKTYPAPTKGEPNKVENCTFQGWKIEGEDRDYDFSTIVFNDFTLTAKWDKCIVYFDSDGGSPVNPISTTTGVQMGEIKVPDPTRDKYKFQYWALYGTTRFIATMHTPTRDFTLKAVWAGLYKVTFDSDGGTPIESQTVASGKKIQMPEPPTKEGYTFEYWALDGKKYIFESNTMGYENITLKAVWKKDEVKKKDAVESQLLASVAAVANPASGVLELKGMAAADRVEVYSLVGAPLHSQALQGEDRVAINVSSWAVGVYLVRIVASDGQKVLRVVVAR